MARELHSLVDLSNENEHRIWLEELRKETNNLIKYARQIPLSSYISEIGRGTAVSHLHGDLLSVSTGQAINPTPTTYNVTVGHGKLVFAIIAGSDVSGNIIVSGTTVNRKTGELTTTDQDVIPVDRLTTDSSTTPASPSRTLWDLKNAYITSKWFTGTVTISTTDLTITDMDTYSIAFEQFNDSGPVTLDTLDITLYEVNTAARFHAYLYSVDVTGSKVDIQAQASLNMGTPAAANRYFRLRKTNINKLLDTTKDGIFISLWYNTPTSNIEDVTCKVWATVGE